MLRQLLSVYYNLPSVEKIKIASKTGYTDNKYVYFITIAENKEENCELQYKMGIYLVNLGFKKTAFPIRNKYGEWHTLFEGKTYYVLRLKLHADNIMEQNDLHLETFHRYGRQFLQNEQISPAHLEWKNEWVKELTLFEQSVFNQKEKRLDYSIKPIINLMPYLIGLCENVIALTRELNVLTQFNYSDYSTFTFHHFQEANIYPVIWTDQILIDHFIRDLAEYIRYLLLNNQGTQVAWQALAQYQIKQSISVYGWNLLIIRLLYPRHLLDTLAALLKEKKAMLNLDTYLVNHELYLNHVAELKSLIEQKEAPLTLPMLKWL